MNESRKRRPNSCLHRLLVLHPAVFLVHYLTLMSMTSVFAVTTVHRIHLQEPPTVLLFRSPNILSCIQRFRCACAIKAKTGWPELRAGGKPQFHLFFGAALLPLFSLLYAEDRTSRPISAIIKILHLSRLCSAFGELSEYGFLQSTAALGWFRQSPKEVVF